jgi:hypothetical protein
MKDEAPGVPHLLYNSWPVRAPRSAVYARGSLCGLTLRQGLACLEGTSFKGAPAWRFHARPVCPPASTQRLASCMAPASREPHGPRGTVREPRRIGACDRPHPSAPVPLARFAPPAYPHGTGRVWHGFWGGGFWGDGVCRLRGASPLAGEDAKSRSWRSQVVDFVGEGMTRTRHHQRVIHRAEARWLDPRDKPEDEG